MNQIMMRTASNPSEPPLMLSVCDAVSAPDNWTQIAANLCVDEAEDKAEL